MARILIKQGDKYIPSTDEDVKAMGEPLGRGSASLKKRLVKIGVRDGLPVYELRSLDEAPGEPKPTPAAPRPTPGPMSVQPSDRDPTRDYLEPYRSQTPIPEFNLGIDGATSTVPVKPGDRARGYQDPVAKAKAQTQAAKAKMKGAIRAPLKAKEFVGPMDPTTDAKRRWEERYLRADAPKPEPLDLSLPPPPPDAPEAKSDPFAKYQVPTSSRESDLPPDDFSQNDQPGGEWVTTEGYQKNLKRPEGGDALGDLGVEPPAPETPEETPSPDLEGKLDEAGGGMFGPRDFNDGEQPTEPPAPTPQEPESQSSDVGAGGGWQAKYAQSSDGEPWEIKRGNTGNLQTRDVADQESLKRTKEENIAAKAKQDQMLEKLIGLVDTQKGTDKEARERLDSERKGLLARYTQGLDDIAKARFMDTLVKNIGKIVAGGVGLHKGLDVAGSYKYEGADTEGMSKDLEGLNRAAVAELEARGKERKDESDKEFDRRMALLKTSSEVAGQQQARSIDLLKLQEEVANYGWSSDVLNFTPARLMQMAEEMRLKADELAQRGLKNEADIELAKADLATRILVANINAGAARDVEGIKAKATVENKGTTEVGQGQKEETQTRPEDVIAQRNALSEALAHLKKLKITDKAFADAMSQGRVQEAVSLFTSKLDSLVIRAEQDKKEALASRLVLARSTLEQMAPFITSTQQLEKLVQTFNELVKKPETELGANIRGTTQSQSSEQKQKQESTTRIQGPVNAMPGVKKELTDEEVQKLRVIVEKSTDPEVRKKAEQMLRDAGKL